MKLQSRSRALLAAVASWVALLAISSSTLAADAVTLNFDLFTNASPVAQNSATTIDLGAGQYTWSYKLDVLEVTSEIGRSVNTISILPAPSIASANGLAATLPLLPLDLDFDVTPSRLQLAVDPAGNLIARFTNIALPQFIDDFVPATIRSYHAVGSFTVVAVPEPATGLLAILATVALGTWLLCQRRGRALPTAS